MTSTLLLGYAGIWILTAIGLAMAAWHLRDELQPAPHSTLVSIAAGAVWPVLVIALAEAAFMAVTQEVMHEEEPLLSTVS